MTTSMPRSKWIVWGTIFLIAALLAPELIVWKGPFWNAQQSYPLIAAYTCRDQFNTHLKDTDRVGYFYETPRGGFKITDNRIQPMLQLQYVLAPLILDHRRDQLDQYEWVIGYFENKKIAASAAQADAPGLNLKVAALCENYVLFQKAR